eukprot:snap_masked-scaffold_3-processed-gene-17.6-mRNA-1 protein AED:1.00 eAED:1.00 QI:0/0/0/0/1/1/2/0/119
MSCYRGRVLGTNYIIFQTNFLSREHSGDGLIGKILGITVDLDTALLQSLCEKQDTKTVYILEKLRLDLSRSTKHPLKTSQVTFSLAIYTFVPNFKHFCLELLPTSYFKSSLDQAPSNHP